MHIDSIIVVSAFNSKKDYTTKNRTESAGREMSCIDTLRFQIPLIGKSKFPPATRGLFLVIIYIGINH